MPKRAQRVLGFDPGTARTGYGLVERRQGVLTMINCGLIETSADQAQAERLEQLAKRTEKLLAALRPDSVATEKLFYATNAKTAMKVAEARGVILAACAAAGFSVAEYTPLQVKQSVTSYGQADKKQVATMVIKLLRLPVPPKPDDVTDALAIAITHEQWAQLTENS